MLRITQCCKACEPIVHDSPAHFRSLIQSVSQLPVPYHSEKGYTMGFAIDISLLFLLVSSILGAITRYITGRGITVTGPLLVLRQFNVTPNNDKQLLVVEGRATGLMSWILTCLKMEPVTTLTMDRHGVSVTGVSLSGQYKQEVPLDEIDSTLGAYSQSITAIALAWVFGGVGLIRSLVIMTGSYNYDGMQSGFGRGLLSVFMTIVITCIYYAYWSYSRRLILAVTAGNQKVGLGFKRGVIGSQNVDFNLVTQALQIIDAQVMKRESPSESNQDD